MTGWVSDDNDEFYSVLVEELLPEFSVVKGDFSRLGLEDMVSRVPLKLEWELRGEVCFGSFSDGSLEVVVVKVDERVLVELDVVWLFGMRMFEAIFELVLDSK